MKYEPNDSNQVQSSSTNSVPTIAQTSDQNLESNQSSTPDSSTKAINAAKTSGNTCNCEPCLERRSIEAEQRHKRLLHAKTQIHHLISCIYHGAFIYAADPDELKSCVDLLMLQEPDLLFRKVDILCQEYVSAITTRLLQLLTNGFHTPVLAYNFVEIMFDDYSRLVNCSTKLITCFPQLEKHLSQFNRATLEQHHINLFQRMVFNQATINRTLSEIVNQLRQGSAQYETKHENKFTATLMRFHKFETKMHEVCVMWRDVQKILDEYHDAKAEERHNEKKLQPLIQHPESPEKWEFYNIEKETFRQLKSKKSEMFLGKGDDAKLSLTLRKCFMSKSTGGQEEESNVGGDKADNESETDPPFESPLNSDGSLSEVQCPSRLTPITDANTTAYLCTEYLQNIRPPSVPSGDSDLSSDNNEQPIFQGHSLLTPLEPEQDSIGSLSPQPCTNDVSDSFIHFDGQASNIPLHSSSRPFLATYQHLHQLQKQLFNPSEHSNAVVPPRTPSPTVKTKTEESSKVHDHDINVNHDSSSEERNLRSPSAVFESAAAELLADLPQMIKNTVVNRVSDIAPFFGELCKDAWSSPSSSSSLSNVVTSPSKDSTVNRTKSKSVKLRKKKKSFSRSKPKLLTDSDTTDNNLQVRFPEAPSLGSHSSNTCNSNDASKECSVDDNDVYESDRDDENVDDEDADDEYDDEEEQSDVCKCTKCRNLMKSYQSSCRNRSYLFPELEQPQFLIPDFDPALEDTRSCKCENCRQLANASNFFASQSSQVIGNLAGYNPNDISDPNNQSPYYNQNIPPHFLIQPHLYGFHPMGTAPTLGPFYGPHPSALSSTESQFINSENLSPSKTENTEEGENTGEGGNMFQHPTADSSSPWNILGSSANSKFAVSQSGATPTSLHEWPASSHQNWLSSGNVLPTPMLTPGCTSAFQHYISSRPQGFFSPFLPTSGSYSHTPGSYFPPIVDTDGSYSSSAEPVNSSSPTSMPASNSTSQSTAYSNTQSNLSSSSILTSSAFPQTSNKYLSSLYAQIPGLASNTLSPLTKAPSSTSGSVPVTSGAIQGQPMHFHPGTSVSLKDVGGHFNMPLHDSANFMFNQTLTQFTPGERPGLQPTSSQNVFTIPTTIGQGPRLPPNPFLESVPLPSSTHNLLSYPNRQAQNPSVTSPNLLSSTTSANSIQIRNHILRRKKLVAQSKLSKQQRPQQQQNHVMKPHDSNMLGDGQPTSNHQKLQRPHTEPITSKSDSRSSPSEPVSQAGSQTIISSPSSDAKAATKQPQIKEINVTKSSTLPQNLSKITSQATSNNVNASDKAPPAEHQHQHLPSYQHPPDACRKSGDGNAVDETQTSGNSNTAGNLNNSKYCNCCYCEFFGNGGPPNAQTNRNTKIRERLQRKLHTKSKGSEISERKKSEVNPRKNVRVTPNESIGISLAPLNEIVSFIEGDKRSLDGAGKKSKKARQKQQKKEKQLEESTSSIMNEKTSDESFPSNLDKTSREKTPETNRQSEYEEPLTNGSDKDKGNSKNKKKKGKTEEKNTEKNSKPAPIAIRQNEPKSTKTVPSRDKSVDKSKVNAKTKQNDSSENHNSVKPIVNGRNKLQKENETSSIKSEKKPESNSVPSKSQPNPSVIENMIVDAVSHPTSVNKSPEQRNNTEKGKPGRKVQSNKANTSTSINGKEISIHLEKPSQNAASLRSANKNKAAVSDSTSKQENRKNAKTLIASRLTKPEESSVVKLDNSSKIDTLSQNLDKNGISVHPVSSKSESEHIRPKNGFVIPKTLASDVPPQAKENSSDSKKNRSRKQRKKNRQSAQSLNNSELVDQVFLPREVLEEDAKELDDTELEIENFKRFCLNSSALNKQKKITVKWKELNLKKNHFS